MTVGRTQFPIDEGDAPRLHPSFRCARSCSCRASDADPIEREHGFTTTAERKIVRVVKEKFCHIPLHNDMELKSAASLSAASPWCPPRPFTETQHSGVSGVQQVWRDPGSLMDQPSFVQFGLDEFSPVRIKRCWFTTCGSSPGLEGPKSCQLRQARLPVQWYRTWWYVRMTQSAHGIHCDRLSESTQ